MVTQSLMQADITHSRDVVKKNQLGLRGYLFIAKHTNIKLEHTLSLVLYKYNAFGLHYIFIFKMILHRPTAYKDNEYFAEPKPKGYWMNASLLFSDSFLSFLFLSGDFFNLHVPFLLYWMTMVLKDWNQSWRLIRSPCSWARVYLKDMMNMM